MNKEESIVAYPHEIKFIDKNGGAISYYVDRKVSDCVKELQDKLSEVESENTQKTIDKLRLQSNWNKLKEWLEEMINEIKTNDIYDRTEYECTQITTLENVLAKLEEIDGGING